MHVAPSTCYIFFGVYFAGRIDLFYFRDRTGILVGKGNVGSYDVEIVCVNAVQTDIFFGLEINP